MTTIIKAAPGVDGIYHKTPNTFNYTDYDITLNGGRAGFITDMEPQPAYLNTVIRKMRIRTGASFIRPDGKRAVTLWLIRRHKLRSPIMEDCELVDMTPVLTPLKDTWMKEHSIYDEIESGDAIYRRIVARNIPAQYAQIRLENNRSDTMWPNKRAILFEDCEGYEIGQERGAGRAGFAISVKDSGPQSEVVISSTRLETISQRGVKRKKDGTPIADSFGAICVEYAKSCLIEDCYINYRNPANHAIQLYDFANKAKGKTGPEDIVVRNCELAAGGNNIALRIENTTKRVLIEGCKGPGQIIVYKMNAAGQYNVARRYPMSEGFKYRV